MRFRQRIELDESPPSPSAATSPLALWLTARLQAVVGSTPSLNTRPVDVADLQTVLERLGGENNIWKRQSRKRRSAYAQHLGKARQVGRDLWAHDAPRPDAPLCLQLSTGFIAERDASPLGESDADPRHSRCVSASVENVCIIETSNEIGGDKRVLHGCIGWARRMMVTSLSDQASVMVECVQNHTVETLIVDEINRKAEVNAAGTVRQRGLRMIVSAHGDLRSFIKKHDLKGMIGGIQSVFVGDDEAKKNMDDEHRGHCRIIWDVVQAVDDVLSGNVDYPVETRYQTMDRRGVQVLLQ